MRPDGSIELKYPWARRVLGTEVSSVHGGQTAVFAGELEIEAERLDGPASAATAITNPQGVHVGSIIMFPTPGCWEVTGRAGSDTLSFVVLIAVDRQPLADTAVRVSANPTALLAIVALMGSALGLGISLRARWTSPHR